MSSKLPINLKGLLHQHKVAADPIALGFPGSGRSIRMTDLQLGRAVSRRYRNRRIGEFLKELDLTEGRSTGISKILKVMGENGSGKPEFETDDDRSYFLVRLPVHPQADMTPKVAEKASEKTSEKILSLMRGNKNITIPEISEALGSTTRAIEMQIAKLKEKVVIERIGPGMSGYWKISKKTKN